MKTRYGYRRWLWIVGALAGMSIGAGIGLGRIQPVGRKAGLVQFDAISELNMDEGFTNWVVFARYWVCRDYYAVSVVWSEPHGGGMHNLKTLVVLSDKAGFRISDDLYSYWVPMNTTHSKPLGARGPFRWAGGSYEVAEMRYAEAEALARRVYVSDLVQLKDPNHKGDGFVGLDVSKRPDGARKLARLKVRAKDDKIESMELFDGQQQSLGRMKYEYEQGGNSSPVARLVAELPARPEKLGGQITVTVIPSTAGGAARKKTHTIKDIDHVYHKGGRTCTVAYKDVAVGDTILRLPVQVDVRVSDDNRRLRSARLMNFKRVDLDKEGVWEAARAFAGLSAEDQAWRELAQKYLQPPEPNLGPMQADPNDLDFVRGLMARYPLPELPAPPQRPEREGRNEPGRTPVEGDPREWIEASRQERTQWLEQMEAWREQAAKMPQVERMDIEPGDARVIRQLRAYYDKTLSAPLTQEQKTELKTEGGMVQYSIPESQRQVAELRDKLRRILAYHRVPPLPEDKPPEVTANDLQCIRQLREHYEGLAAQEGHGLEGQLKALHALTRLDRMVKDHDAFEVHTIRYLQKIRDAGLNAMYMVGGHGNMETLVEAGQYEKANKLMRQWAARSAAENEPDAVFRFVARDGDGSKRDPWASVQLLDQFLRKPGLSPVQRYEALALRAIASDRADRLLADPATGNSGLRKAQAQWILSTTTREQLAKRVMPALRQALSAWQSLGEARWSDAKPYSTANMFVPAKDFMGYPEATRLQETSALLDQIIRERAGQMDTRPLRRGR